MNKYFLSICIPTANRKLELGEQLNRITAQIEKLINPELVQIVVCDNTTVIEQIIDINEFKNINLKYIKNSENIGYARNVNNVINHAEADFCWLLSDDDYIFDNAIEIIIDNLLKNKDANYITFECGATSNGKLFNDKMYFKDIDKLYYTDGNEFLERYWVSIVFISINIFNRKNVIEHMNNYNLFHNINEAFQNSLIGITFIKEYGNVLVIKDALLNDNYGNKVYAPENMNNVAVEKYYKLLKQLISFELFQKIINDMSSELLRNIVHYGMFSVVYNIEYSEISEYIIIYKNIYNDVNIALKLRVAAFIIYILLIGNKKFSKLGLKFILLFKKNRNYRKIKNELDGIIKYGNSKIESTY